MGLVDRDLLTRRIRDAVDIVEVVGRYVALRRAGANLKGLCPFHEEKTPSFNVHPVRQIFKCYGCGVGGDVFKFVQLREKVDFPEARRILAEQANISLRDEERGQADTAGPGKADLARANDWARKVFLHNYQSAAGQVARDYVEKRGISPEMVAAFGIGFAVDSFDSLLRKAGQSGVHPELLLAAGLVKARESGGYYDTFRNRLMFPITDPTGRVLGFGGRTLGDDPAKYLNTPATALFDKSSQLFGLDKARDAVAKTGRVIVVEGYTDCIMAHQFGFGDAVATLGTAMTETHAGLLRRYCDRVVLLFDSDEAGQRAADRALSVSLMGGLEVLLARVPEGKDPCDYLLSAGADGFEKVLKAGTPALEFKWKQVVSACEGSDTAPGRRRAIEAFLEQLSVWTRGGAIDAIAMGMLLTQLSGMLSVPAEDLRRQLLRMSGPGGSKAQAATPTGAEHRSAGGLNAEQRALREIIEVLLNASDYFPAVAEHLDPARIEDPALATVAVELIGTLTNGEPFRLDEFIGQFELPSYGGLITDLQLRGEHRGGYDAAISGALACLDSRVSSRQAARLAEAIRARSEGADTPPDDDERLRALGMSLQAPRFATARALRKYLSP